MLLIATIGIKIGCLNLIIKARQCSFKFLTVNLIVYAFNTLCLFILVGKIALNALIAQIFAIGVGMVINFVLNKIWTFNQTEKATN